MHIITRSCVLLLWMYTLTFVKSQDCTRQQFINGPLFDSNFDTTDMEDRYPAGKQIRVSCNIGYSGFFKLLCIEGRWQSRGTKCEPRSCGHPGDAQFADFHLEKGDDFVFGSQVVYTCHKGYQMVSRKNYRICMAEGWDGVVPVCEAQQCPVINVENNVQVTGDTEEAIYGNVVRFSCKLSNEILHGSPEMYCDENGEWSGSVPTCKVITCEVPVIANGYVTEDIQEYKEHDILHFECNEKYRRTEERPSKCTKIGMRAEWSPTPACESIKCKLTLPPLYGTSYEPVFRNVFSPGESVRVTCGERYWISTHLDQAVETICKDDGQWTVRPVCQEVTCIRQDQHVSRWSDYWKDRITMDETVGYWCRSGYKRTGGATRAICRRGGWEPDPLCQEIICDRLDVQNAVITNNNKDKYKNNERVTYACNEGYNGHFTLTCTESGWRGNPQCTEITCNARTYRDAEITNFKQEYKYNEQANYVCRNAYKGGFSLTCTEHGWSGEPRCTEITCDRHIDPDADFVRNPQRVYRYNDRVDYVCKTGGGRYSLTCGEDGWVGSPQCTGTKCPKPEVSNGFVVGPHNGTVYYTCNEGYKLLSKGWWGEAKCNGSEWAGLQQCIEKTDCLLPDIPNGKVTPPQKTNYQQNESIRISCNKGYRLEVKQLTCHNGTWNQDNLEQICILTAKYCSPPPRVENAVVTTSYQKEYMQNSEVTYQCHHDYRMEVEGQDTIRCRNGKWEKKKIKCTQEMCEHPTISNGRVRPQKKKI